MSDILAIGEPMIEFNQTVPGEPTYLQGYGGDTSNFCIAAARQGARVGYITRLGDDGFGRMFRALWEAEGVDAGGVLTEPGAFTAAYFVTHSAAGHEFSFLRSGSAASRLAVADLPRAALAAARYLHVSGISQAISGSACDAVFAAIAAARESGARICYDSNLRLKLWPLARARAVICETIGQSDYFFPSLDDARALSGRDDPQAILDWCYHHGARAVLLKLGGDGVTVSEAPGAAPVHLPGHRVEAVDATGAGDCFAGAAVARLAAGDDLLDAARYANAAAALTTTGFGAVAPIPRPQDVRDFLARQR